MIYWIALFASVIANIGANLAFKHVMVGADLSMDWKSLGSVAFDPVLWLAFALCFILLGGYLFAMKAIPMGTAYTVATSLSIVGIAVSGAVLYGETLGSRSIVGIALIMAGLIVFADTDKQETPAAKKAEALAGPPLEPDPAQQQAILAPRERQGSCISFGEGTHPV